jgi:RNA polymerase sigma-70 factor (ECF subfamily)
MHLRKTDVLKRAEQIEDFNSVLQSDVSVVEKMETKELLKLITQMPVGFRTVFNMYAIEGYTHEEIAKELRITPGGSRSQLSRARIWLREKLSNLK